MSEHEKETKEVGDLEAEGGNREKEQTNEQAERQGVDVETEPPAEAGSREVVKMNDPKLPSEEEIKQHELTHLPFRN